ncbi:hypothetical protein [Pontibacter sp. G13]|uniref:hypothetical protein n=1 Tax=Pontibacter sp. G13 TaxID=3074898 RepID=UPI00288A7109|nr:hypothetical protein [Pontibacter sp. G13]WNJ19510.1 hypothetical protein RJD25_03365 [Pontibacter sp. G13]
MIDLNTFIKICEKDLILNRNLSKDTLGLAHNMSNKNKALCKPILDYIGRNSVDIQIKRKETEFLSEERILVCRLIPLLFELNTSNPTWSSYMLTQAIKSASEISNVKLSEIGIAFLEILYEFDTPLNKVVYNFCIDFSREFTMRNRKRLYEFEPLTSWNTPNGQITESVALFKYFFASIDSCSPKFIIETLIALVQNEFFDEFANGTKFLFEDQEYKQKALDCIMGYEISNENKDLRACLEIQPDLLARMILQKAS